MEKKEQKKGKKSIEVKMEVEPKPASKHPKMVSISKDELEQLRTERDAFKMTAEKMSGSFLDKCRECKELEKELDSYKRHHDRLFQIGETWKKRAMEEMDKHLFAMDALRTAFTHIWWLRGKLSWFRLWKHRRDLIQMDIDLDRMVARIEGLDKE